MLFLFLSFFYNTSISPGRGALTKDSNKYELQCPTILFPTLLSSGSSSSSSSMTKNIKIAFIATSPTSCHSIAITTTGIAYGWGRNETGQLGLGYVSAVVPTPTQLSVSTTTTGGGGESGGGGGIKFVGAGVGKYHTILIGSDGMAYASGGNLCGQLGINNQGCRGIDKFKKCIVSGQGDSGEEEGDVKIVQV
jgi:alpha-tubulin suppressor-like RCC1 family protein